jgi:probable rRNA maturation factor
MGISLNFETKLKRLVQKDIKTYQILGNLVYSSLKIKAPVEVGLLIVSNPKIKALNLQYRKINKVTDVLSFPFYQKTELTKLLKKQKPVYLGDIVIAYDKAKQQAANYEHSLKREMSFLYVHGLLHLLGYDHKNKQQEQQMFRLQDQILELAKIRR